jgi:hypothetical protein
MNARIIPPSIDSTIERLERRLFMDGNVHTAVVDGDLVITGDRDDNSVIVQRLAGKVRVTGLHGTSIDGGSFKEFSPAFDDLEILMRQGGADDVSVQGGIKINGDLVAYLGEGEMVIEGSAGALQIGEKLIVRGGELGNVHVRNDVIVGGTSDIANGGDVNVAAARAMVPDFAAAHFSHPLAIDNPYFPLVPGTTYKYEETSLDEETGETVTQQIVVDVLNQTKTILGLPVRVLHDRVFEDGLLIEDTLDYHAQDDNGNVWYFGEQTTEFEYDEDGNLIDSSTAGSWQAGVKGAKPGIIMEAKPKTGDRYYQEFSPNQAEDFAEVVATTQTVKGPLGTFRNVVRTEDTNLLEPHALEHKFYAPGVGIVQELSYDRETGQLQGTLRLLSMKLNGKNVTQVVSPTGFTGTNASGRVTGPVQLFGEATIDAGGPITITGVHFGDTTTFAAGSTIAIGDAQFEDFTIDAGDIVGFRNVTATEEVDIHGDVDVFIFASTLTSNTSIRLGGGDNELAIRGSVFKSLFADGGAGDDTFDDRGGNDFGALDLRRFES